MMLENQAISDNNNYTYELMDTNNLPAIEKLTGATSVNHTYKYWNPVATNDSELKLNKGKNFNFYQFPHVCVCAHILSDFFPSISSRMIN